MESPADARECSLDMLLTQGQRRTTHGATTHVAPGAASRGRLRAQARGCTWEELFTKALPKATGLFEAYVCEGAAPLEHHQRFCHLPHQSGHHHAAEHEDLVLASSLSTSSSTCIQRKPQRGKHVKYKDRRTSGGPSACSIHLVGLICTLRLMPSNLPPFSSTALICSSLRTWHATHGARTERKRHDKRYMTTSVPTLTPQGSLCVTTRQRTACCSAATHLFGCRLVGRSAKLFKDCSGAFETHGEVQGCLQLDLLHLL